MSFILSPEKIMHLKHWDYSQDITLLKCEMSGCKAEDKADFRITALISSIKWQKAESCFLEKHS